MADEQGQHDSDDAALDRLLRQACWPEPDPASVVRLRQQWQQRGARSAWWRGLGFAGAAAAAAVALMFIWIRGDGEPPLPQFASVQLELQPQPLWREPNAYERLLGVPQSPSAQALSTQSQPAVGDTSQADQMLGRIIDPSTREAALRELKSMPDPPLDRLIEHLGDGRVDRRLAAAKALGEVCDPELVVRLRWMVQRNVHRREALAALLQCHQPQAGEFLLAARGNRVIDAEIRSVQMQMKQVF